MAKEFKIRKKQPDSNVPQVLDASSDVDFIKITLILPAKIGKQKGKSKVIDYSQLKKFPLGFLIGDEDDPKELLLDARLYTNN